VVIDEMQGAVKSLCEAAKVMCMLRLARCWIYV